LQLSRFVGIAEIAAAVGLLAGIAVKPVAIMTATAVCLLMAGALGYQPKARDKGAVLLPAEISGLAAIALLRLTIIA
jgi:MprA protease rhombosortase-interaction domain-containing protein